MAEHGSRHRRNEHFGKGAGDLIFADGFEAGDTSSWAITNAGPTAAFTATPSSGTVPLAVAFDASASRDPSSTITSWTWDFGDGNSGSGVLVEHSYEDAGQYLAVLTVTSADGESNSAAMTIEALPNQSPTASFVATPSNGQAPLTVTFDASASSDGDGEVVSHAWSFGDAATDTGAVTSHLYGAAGVYEVTLTVTDNGAATDLQVETVVVSEPQPVVPQVDPPLARTLSTHVPLSGIAEPNVEIEIVSDAGTVRVFADAMGAFSAMIDLLPNRRNHLYVTAIDPAGRRSAPLVLEIIHDAVAPVLNIDFPFASTELTEDTVTVAGRVGDLLSGFLGLEVLVEGEPANVIVGVGTNGTFERSGVPLVSGANTLSVTATDVLGNTVMREITVNRTTPVGPMLEIVSGDAQSAPAGSLLASPVVVRVLDTAGAPFAGKLVDFAVDLSDGYLRETPAGGSARFLQARTDAAGEATVYWTLGSDAGCANNRLAVTSADIAGSIFFTASADPAAASQIHVGSGNHQRAEVAAPAPEPLRVWVNDGRNGVGEVTVTFTAHDGALVNGAVATTVTTDLTGHVEVSLTLGPNAGPQVVEADFIGNSGPAAIFQVEGIARNPELVTTLAGRVVDNAERGVGGAICRLQVADSTFEVTSGVDGNFLFEGIPAGPARLEVDGLSATSAGATAVPAGSFPVLGFPLVLIPEAENTLPDAVRLPPLDPANARLYDGTTDVELTIAGMEGLRMMVRAGSMRRVDGSLPSPSDPALVALNPVHIDDVPMAMPDGAAPPFAWTLQPAGATFDPPVEITLPNMSALPAGSAMFFLSFDHVTERFEIVATGRVSDDGAQMVSDPGSGLFAAGWGGACPPYPNTTNGAVNPGEEARSRGFATPAFAGCAFSGNSKYKRTGLHPGTALRQRVASRSGCWGAASVSPDDRLEVDQLSLPSLTSGRVSLSQWIAVSYSEHRIALRTLRSPDLRPCNTFQHHRNVIRVTLIAVQ